MFELRSDATSKTAENFKVLCEKFEGEGYVGLWFYCVILFFMC